MSWKEDFIELLKSKGETDSSLRNLYVRAHNGDPSARAKMVKLHNENNYYLPMGATTAEDKIGDITSALKNYFGSIEDESTNQSSQPDSPENEGSAKNGSTANNVTWQCSCGYAENTRKFCAECGKPKPQDETWQCQKCGKINTKKFCPNCGTARP